jgi:hypothetical protein
MTPERRQKMPTEPAEGWGLKVDGPRPYMACEFSSSELEIVKVVSQTYHKPIKVVIIPLREWQRLKRLEAKYASSKTNN